MSLDQQGQFYIKRLVALGGERVRIGDDRHLYIDDKRLDASTPRFAKIYSFDPAVPPRESRYSGHVNGGVAPLFPNAEAFRVVPPDHYMAMGDNTVNSSDSRAWGSFPKENVIGKSFFVYWPFGSQDGRPSRFGWGNR
jgi:signal peptidase I